jgi:hypothetical protein
MHTVISLLQSEKSVSTEEKFREDMESKQFSNIIFQELLGLGY